MFMKYAIVKGRKNYRCLLCRKAIGKGEQHVYITQLGGYDTGSYRLHLTCNETMNVICTNCGEQPGECDMDIRDCWKEHFRDQDTYEGENE